VFNDILLDEVDKLLNRLAKLHGQPLVNSGGAQRGEAPTQPVKLVDWKPD